MHLTTMVTPTSRLIATCLLSALTLIHATENSVVGIKDGLELVVATVTTPESPMAMIECRLHNTTDQDIPFDSSTPTHRLTFKLVDASGVELPMDPEWKRLNAYDEEGFARRHASSAIKAGKDRLFSFRPDQAYGERWRMAARLVVNWEPGIDWSTEKPYTKGRGLAVTYPIPKEEAAAPKETMPVPQVQPIKPGSKTLPRTSKEPFFSSVPWTVIVVLTVTATFLFRQMIKRRS